MNERSPDTSAVITRLVGTSAILGGLLFLMGVAAHPLRMVTFAAGYVMFGRSMRRAGDLPSIAGLLIRSVVPSKSSVGFAYSCWVRSPGG
jgi:hypothetical protein